MKSNFLSREAAYAKDKDHVWFKQWRFDALFLVLTKLSLVGLVLPLMDFRDNQDGTIFYNAVFLDLLTVFVAAVARSGQPPVSWTISLAVVQGVSFLVLFVPFVYAGHNSCWDLDDCVSQEGRRMFDLFIFVISGLILVVSLQSFASSIYILVYSLTISII
jgi:hypothetical protein